MQGHDWVFSNELKSHSTGFPAGSLFNVANHQGKWIGVGHYNPGTLIAVRILSRSPQFDKINWLKERIRSAKNLRDRLYSIPFYRAIFGESDGLPGLVVDRFGDYLSAQITTAGMNLIQQDVQAALIEIFEPRGIVWTSETRFREMEGLGREPLEPWGEVPDEVAVGEGSLMMTTNLAGGQKTGWFFDQRDSRLQLHRFAAGTRVLDVFSYAGAWSVHALAAGAVSATCIDSSKSAIALAERNAKINQFEIQTICGDAFSEMKALIAKQARYDLVIVDPPALIKRKKDFEEGLQAYYQLNRLGLQLIAERGGLLVSCSCSQHLPESELLSAIRHATLRFGRQARVLEFCGQSADHPVHPAMPESRYLKTLFVWIDPMH